MVTFSPDSPSSLLQAPCSKDHFIDTIVPKLRTSLSVALKHYPPLAGKILRPSESDEKPVLRYVPEEDDVTFQVFESDKDFDYLVGNFTKDSDLFYDFIPGMPPAKEESDCKLFHSLAVRVTLFQGSGICIGVSNHHSAGDASSIVGFLKSWAFICKNEGDDQLPEKAVPVFDRSLIKDSGDIASILWSKMNKLPSRFHGPELPTGRVRATYTFTQSDIKNSRNQFSKKKPVFPHLSSFVVSAAYFWSCLAKSLAQDEEIQATINNDDEEDTDFFLFAADCRSRIDPPVPENYFGNCLTYGLAKVPHLDLIGEQGFFAAAEAITSPIENKLNQKDKILKGYENAGAEISKAAQRRMLSVAGSARADIYGLDFGWGGPVKCESPSIDQDRYAFSICRDSNGGLEFGVSLPANKMAVFAVIFVAGRDGGVYAKNG